MTLRPIATPVFFLLLGCAALRCSRDLDNVEGWSFSDPSITPSPCEERTSLEQNCIDTLTMGQARIGMTEEFIEDHRNGTVRSDVLAQWAALELSSTESAFEVICRKSPDDCHNATVDFAATNSANALELSFDGWQWKPISGHVEMNVTQVSHSRYGIEVRLHDLVLENPDPDAATPRVLIPQFAGHREARFEYERVEGRDF